MCTGLSLAWMHGSVTAARPADDATGASAATVQRARIVLTSLF
jgi:hypothetical protein